MQIIAMSPCLVSLLLLVALPSLFAATDITLSDGHTISGNVLNFENVTVYEYLGIPYAKPPVGPNRFRKPQPLAVIDRHQNATSWAPNCMQPEKPFNIKFNSQQQSEDCLFLNIWSPSERNETPKSVMVYIHGKNY